jgi:hypothetical protein
MLPATVAAKEACHEAQRAQAKGPGAPMSKAKTTKKEKQ